MTRTLIALGSHCSQPLGSQVVCHCYPKAHDYLFTLLANFEVIFLILAINPTHFLFISFFRHRIRELEDQLNKCESLKCELEEKIEQLELKVSLYSIACLFKALNIYLELCASGQTLRSHSPSCFDPTKCEQLVLIIALIAPVSSQTGWCSWTLSNKSLVVWPSQFWTFSFDLKDKISFDVERTWSLESLKVLLISPVWCMLWYLFWTVDRYR